MPFCNIVCTMVAREIKCDAEKGRARQIREVKDFPDYSQSKEVLLREGYMPQQILKEFEDATCDMSLPVMIALLSRIYDQLSEDVYFKEASARLGEALKMLLDEHEKSAGNKTIQ